MSKKRDAEVILWVNERFAICAPTPYMFFQTPEALSAGLDLLLEIYANVGLGVEYKQEQYLHWRKQVLPDCPECLPTTEWFMQKCLYLTGHEHMVEIWKHWNAYKSYLDAIYL